MKSARRTITVVALIAPTCLACAAARDTRTAHTADVVTPLPSTGTADQDIVVTSWIPAPSADRPPQSQVVQAQFVAPAEELPPEILRLDQGLMLADVLESVDAAHPLVRAAMQERAIAEGQRLSAQGGFDLDVEAYGISQPLGFYKMHRAGLTLTQPVWRGGYVYSGYRVGDGNFPEWYGERQTNEGGEFKLGASLPLWRDRVIDKRRAAIAQADLAFAAAEPFILTQLLEIDRAAAIGYWTWVAAGRSLHIERELLRVTEERNGNIRRRVDLGDLPASEVVDNERAVASRRIKVVAAERKLQEAAIKLSLFLRTPDGQPFVATPDMLPADFPRPLPTFQDDLGVAVERALAARPENRELELLRQSLMVDLRVAQNMTQPALDATLWGSKDVGAPASSKGDKTPYEMEGGLLAELPLQRREARGKIRAVRAKLAQLNAKRRFVNDKIAAEVRDAHSAITLAQQRVRDTAANASLARQVEAFERRRFELGDSNVFMVNQRESAAVEAGLAEVEALADYYRAWAIFRTSQGDRADDERS